MTSTQVPARRRSDDHRGRGRAARRDARLVGDAAALAGTGAGGLCRATARPWSRRRCAPGFGSAWLRSTSDKRADAAGEVEHLGLLGRDFERHGVHDLGLGRVAVRLLRHREHQDALEDDLADRLVLVAALAAFFCVLTMMST